MRSPRAAAALVLTALLLAPHPVPAIPEGPPGATTGDRSTPFAGLALAPEAQPFTGAATTSLALEVPPGRNGMTPNLRLAYSSQAGGGPYGAGWDLPIGRIERSTRLGVPRYRDDDVFAVILPDGAGELVPIGLYQYGLRVDESHVSVTASPATNTWTLHDRSGRTYTFGTSAAARTGPDPSVFGGTFAWHLTQIRDANGNLMDVAYAPFDGVTYPSSVRYGGHAAGLAHPFEVAFAWRTNPGAPRVSFAAGFRQRTAWVLDTIDVRYAGGRVRRYLAFWRTSGTGGQPLLREVRLESGGAGLLEREDGTPASAEFAYHEVADVGFDPVPAAAELHVNSFRGTGACNTRDFLDMNGDGRPDLVRTQGWKSTNKVWKVHLNQGRGAETLFAPAPTLWWAPTNCLVERRTSSNATFRALVDLTGDGRPDYVDADVHPWRVYPNTGTGFATPPERWDLGGPKNVRNADTATGGVTLDLVDLNGDGLPDSVSSAIWTPSRQRWAVRWNTGAGFSPPEEISAPHGYLRNGGPDTPEQNIQSDLFDLNGDGLPDKVSAKSDGHWNVWYGTGRGFAPGTQWASPPRDFLRSWNAAEEVYRYDVLDVNGDGLPDFVDGSFWTDANPYWFVYANTGEGFAPGRHWWAPERLRRRWGDGDTGLRLDTFDVDGNGYPDVVRLPGGSGTTASVWFGHPTPAPADGLAMTTDAVRGQTVIEYAVSTAFNGPNVDPRLRDGAHHLPFPVFVASAVVRHDPAHPAAVVTARYRYDGGYFDAVRREFRGFHVASRTDDHGATEWTQFHQTDALRGKPYRVATFARSPWDGDTTGDVRETLFEWGCAAAADCTQPDPGGRWFPVLQRRARFDLSSAADVPWTRSGPTRAVTSVFSYDACGNVLREEAADDDGKTVVSTAAYPALAGGCSAARVCTGICDRAGNMGVEGGVQKALEYDGAGNLVATTLFGPGNPTTIMRYDAYGNLVSLTDPRGVETTTTYETTTQIYPETVVRDAAGVAHATTFAYNRAFGTLERRTEPSGATTAYAHDAFGRLAAVAEPGATLAQPTRQLAYTLGTGQRVDTFVREPNRGEGYLVQSAYWDALGRPLQTQVTKAVNAAERTVVVGAVEYAAGGRVARAYTPIVRNGPPTVRVEPGGSPAVTFAHDELGRRIAAVNPDGTVTRTSYATARVVRRCDARHGADPGTGQCVEEQVDGFDRVVARRTYHGAGTVPYATEERTYDGAGWLREVRQNGDARTAIVTSYDALGRRIAVQDPDSGTWRFGYDAGGNLVYRDDPEPGQHVEVEYDALGRPRRRLVLAGDAPGEGAATVVAEYAYDAAAGGVGRLARVTDPSGETRVDAYDARGNVLDGTKLIVFEGVTRAFTTRRTYDEVGRLATETIPYPDADGAETLYYDYSAAGALVGVRADHGTYVAGLLHDELDRTTHVTYGNGVHDRFVYRPATGGYHLAEIFTDLPGQGTARDVLYQDWDENGNVRAVRDLLHPPRRRQSATLFAEYDAASRVTSAVQCGAGGYASAFGHDAYGNLTAKDGQAYQYAPERPHQPAAVGGEPLAYDANGNMVGLPGGRTLRYDAEGRLAEVRRAGEPAGTYLYDFEGNRVAARTAEGTTFFFPGFDVRDGTVVRHLRAGDRVIASSPVSATGPIARAPAPSPALARAAGGVATLVLLGFALAVPGRRRLGPFGRVRRGSVALVAVLFWSAQLPVPPPARAQCDPDTGLLPPGTVFYHPDHLGSPRLLTDPLGRLLEHLIDRPYGTRAGAFDPQGQEVAESRGTFQFTGHRGDDGTGLHYFGARYYDPGLGMFVSHDPARQFASPYSYGGGDPLNGRDPTGGEFLSLLAGLLTAALIGAGIGFALAFIQGAASGAPATQAFRSALLSAAFGAATGVALGIVGGVAKTAFSEVVVARLAAVGYAASAGASTYRAIDSFRAGQYVAGFLAVAGAVQALKGALSALDPPAQTQAAGAGGDGAASGSPGQNRNGIAVRGDVEEYDQALNYLKRDAKTAAMIERLEGQGDLTVVMNNAHNDSFDPATQTVNWDPTSALRTSTGGTQSPALGLGHELGHAAGRRWLTRILGAIPAGQYGNLEEWRVIRLWEVGAATRLGEGVRYDHLGSVYRVPDPTSF